MYAILDIESTGGKYNEEGIMEIAIHRFNGHEVVDKFITLINPERDIQPFVVNLTGINNKMLTTAPKFHEVAKRIVEITSDTVLVAHNAQFDYRILRTEFRRLGYDFQRKTICTVDLSKKLIPEAESHSLGKLVRSLGIAVSDRHRANGDALATLKLFKLLLNKDSNKTVIKSVVREETLGELSTKQLDIVDRLPSETGVYYMHDKNGEILFIGKSKNIKKRVNQHFTNVGPLARKLQKETKKVTFEKTGSELVALLKEHHEIKRNTPLFNDKKRQRGYSHGAYAFEDAAGLLSLKSERKNGQSKRLGSFNTFKASDNFLHKIKKEFHLEEEENTAGRNEKILKAIEKYSIDNRSLVLLDKGRELGEQSAILIKQGKLNGVGFVDLNYQLNNIHILESIIAPIEGDEHSTFIIESYLRRQKRIKMIPIKE
ncbi:exonuclease domain-containing protein [Croceitalea sp. MTPC9]|uniref:exonuclease domain-containing protein n=1 Tax=unclassified Croceitalea TaxID=2632280 RepID=UPI002B382DC4|nr:exonuclease domain-containing protein [Croceitalea sp. MTPC6]GMN15504.1 exonuclease domain-containing protein [Croceitalea sp. MTPC9]